MSTVIKAIKTVLVLLLLPGLMLGKPNVHTHLFQALPSKVHKAAVLAVHKYFTASMPRIDTQETVFDFWEEGGKSGKKCHWSAILEKQGDKTLMTLTITREFSKGASLIGHCGKDKDVDRFFGGIEEELPAVE